MPLQVWFHGILYTIPIYRVPSHSAISKYRNKLTHSRFVIAPLDVVKIRLQLQTHNPAAKFTHNGPLYRGIFPTMRTIVTQEGIAGLWKGNIPAEALYLAYGASQFLTYQQTHLIITKSGWEVPESVKSFVAGATAGGLATTATYPLDLLRTRFAAQGQEKVCLHFFSNDHSSNNLENRSTNL